MSGWSHYSAGLRRIDKFVFAAFAMTCFLCAAPVFAQSETACSAEISFTNAKPAINPTNVINMNIFSTVSNPSGCMPADIHISATFYDFDDNLICSGTIEVVTTQTSNVMSTNLEIRPLSALEFVRVLNPRRPPAKRLFCKDLEGSGEVGSTQIAAAASLRLRATILPRHGGIATAEARMTLNGR